MWQSDFFFSGNGSEESLTIVFVEMNLANLVYNVLVVKGDESEPPVTVCYLVVGQHCLFDLAELLEVSLDVLQAGGGGQSANKDLAGSHHQLRVRLARHRHLRLNQFPVQLEKEF